MQTRGTLGSRTKERKPQAFASRLNPSLAPPSPLLSWTTSLLPQSPRYVLVYQKQLNTILATCPPPSSALFTHVPSHTHTHTHTHSHTHTLSLDLSLCAHAKVELAEAYKDDCNHLQFVVDGHLSRMQKEGQGAAKSLTRRKSSIKRQKKNQARHVVLIASMEGIRVVDSRSKEEFLFHFIKDIKLWGHVTMGKEDRAFAFVSCDAHLQSISCHMFFTRSAQEAQELEASVAKAVEASNKVDALQGGQPFMPVARTKGLCTIRGGGDAHVCVCLSVCVSVRVCVCLCV